MGGKPKKKPLTFFDLSSAYDRISLNWNKEKKTGEFWEVWRRLGPNNKAKKTKMAITGLNESRIMRGPNKGCWKMVLTVIYADDTDEGFDE
jgi:hypothetical protein